MKRLISQKRHLVDQRTGDLSNILPEVQSPVRVRVVLLTESDCFQGLRQRQILLEDQRCKSIESDQKTTFA